MIDLKELVERSRAYPNWSDFQSALLSYIDGNHAAKHDLMTLESPILLSQLGNQVVTHAESCAHCAQRWNAFMRSLPNSIRRGI